eukprot:CAMPEP_0177595784 /NCGR_PEP_ID=MMETSP0419_2-20121207/10584_1 /TAXON_ID=582737 /ORGANISM="Tetraselmis sp., Strain GSL018" /LENGTH=249 /DNA_ID=CAMNT_0019087353 /DNA_START=365 /DNA_END=1112 /DNA_ORIENTATION=+
MDGGANASVRFELDRPENKGLKRGLSCIEKVYSVVQTTSAGQKLSFADTIALAAAYAVGSTKGPRIEMPIGRADATEADPEGRLPDETAPISELKSNFKQKGFTVKEFVALCGSHTLGNKGFGDPAVFDNEYFKILLNQPWNDPSNEMGKMIGLPSDRVLITDEECLELVHMYAKDKDLFFADFSSALVKLSALGTASADPRCLGGASISLPLPALLQRVLPTAELPRPQAAAKSSLWAAEARASLGAR